MEQQYLKRLSTEVQAFVAHIESRIGMEVRVVREEALNSSGPMRQGMLKVDVEPDSVRLHVPTNDYFPDGAVRHELLHVQRMLLDNTPRLVPSDEALNDDSFAEGLLQLDNAIEHLVIVPIELKLHPERAQHWESVMRKAWDKEVEGASDALNQRMCALLHWTFLSRTLPASAVSEYAGRMLEDLDLLLDAEMFSRALSARLDDKVAAVAFFFDTFPTGRDKVELEYTSAFGATQYVKLPPAKSSS